MEIPAKFKAIVSEMDKELIEEFRLYLSEEIEKEYIKQLMAYDPMPDILNGVGVEANLNGVFTIKAITA